MSSAGSGPTIILHFTFPVHELNKFREIGGGEYTFENVVRYTFNNKKDIDIFAFEKVFVPISYENTHWYFAMINMAEKMIQIYNSSEDEESQANQDLHHLLQYLRDEHKRRKDGINKNTTMVKPARKYTVEKRAAYDNDQARLDREASLVDQNRKQLKRESSRLEGTKRKAPPFSN